jgi:hypothetical protein
MFWAHMAHAAAEVGLHVLSTTALGAALGPALPFVVGGALVGTVFVGAGVSELVEKLRED